MQTLKFKNKESAKLFEDYAKVKASKIEEQENGEVIMAYCHDEPKTACYSQYDLEEAVYKAMCQSERYFDERIKYIYERIDRLAKIMAEHGQGHLPAAKTTSQMQSAVNALGWGEDYDIKKKTIVVEDGDSIMEARWC